MKTPVEISSVYARLLLQSRLLPAKKLLAGSGLTEARIRAMSFIGWNQQSILFRNLAQVQSRPDWAASLGGRFGISAHGPLGFAALSAPHLRAALDTIATYLPIRTTAITLKLSETEQHLDAQLIDHTQDKEVFNWVSDMILKTLESLVSTIRGYPVDYQASVLLEQPRPQNSSDLKAVFDAKVVYSAGQNALRIPSKWLLQPSPLHDESVYRANIEKCIDAMAQRGQNTSAAGAVHHVLQKHFDDCIHQKKELGPPPSLEKIANRLHLTSRTLIRHLHSESSSYKAILLDLRLNYAGSLLCDARLTVADVGELLGYREPANFGRAFKRWHGVSPASWRRR